MSVIYLIRHGKTAANDQHLYCGSTDLPLSQGGKEELQHIHYNIGKNVRFLTSGMKRTSETLQILFGDVPYACVPAFREMDFGAFEMKSYAELKSDPAYLAWITGDNEANVTPGGESGVEMTRRVLTAFHDLLESEEDVVLVTHGGVIAAIMGALFPQEGKNRYQWQPRPGYGYKIDDTGYREIPVSCSD